MPIQTLPLGPLKANCYILSAPGESHCLVVDPGGDAPRLPDLLDRQGLTPAAVLLTHGHFDHVEGVVPLLRRWPELEVFLHPADHPGPDPRLFPLKTRLAQLPHWDGLRPLEDGAQLCLAGLTLRVLHTPGHSSGSVTFLLDGAILTGDTLFDGSVGRTDLPGSLSRDLTRSLSRLAALEGDWAVCPGHGPSTTLEAQRACNPYLREAMV